MDDIVDYGARADLEKLWQSCREIQDPHERYRHYWANKQAIFTRYVIDKPDNAQSYEFKVSAKMVEELTRNQYNIVMETTGLSPALVKFGLTAPHYKHYNKMVIHVDIDDVEKAKLITHSRLIKEMNTDRIYGGEQFGQYLDVICDKAKDTFEVCKKIGEEKNEEIANAGDDSLGKWHFAYIRQDFTPARAHTERIEAFYRNENFDQSHPNCVD